MIQRLKSSKAAHRLQVAGVPTIVPSLLILGVLLVIYGGVRVNAFSTFNLQELSNVTATLAILAVGQTVVVISGGFDFSAIAVLAFLNTFMVTQLGMVGDSYILMSALVLLVAILIGALNGFLVGYLRIQSIIATIAMFFVLSGGALAFMNTPGGGIDSGFTSALAGTWGVSFPASAGMMLITALIWIVLKKSRFGTNLYAVGSNSRAAYARGVPVKATLVKAYAFAGLFYGIAALNYTAATGSGDPRVSFVLLGQMFAAVIIGGTIFGGGRGGAVGSILGALSLAVFEAILFSVGFESYYTGIVFGFLLLVVVLPAALGPHLIERYQANRRHLKPDPVEEGTAL